MPMVSFTGSTAVKFNLQYIYSCSSKCYFKCYCSCFTYHFFYSFLFSVKPENVQLSTNITANKTCPDSHWNFTCLVGAANPEVTYYQLLENDIAVDTDSSGMWMRTLSNSGFFTYKCLANNTVGTTISVNEENVTIAGNNFTSIFYFLRKRLLYVLFVCQKISLLRVVECMKFNNFKFLFPLASYADILSTPELAQSSEGLLLRNLPPQIDLCKCLRGQVEGWARLVTN